MIDAMARKTCVTCGLEKNILDFHKHKLRKDGHSNMCKECAKIKTKQWSKNNKLKKIESDRQYRSMNKDKLNKYFKEYYYENKETILAKQLEDYKKNPQKYIEKYRVYYNKNKEKCLQYRKDYREENKEYLKEYFKEYGKTDKRKAHFKNMKGARRSSIKSGDVTKEDILEIEHNYKTCYWCNKKLDKMDMHLDHYVPLSKNGKHTKSNLVATCSKCNLSKGAKDPIQYANSIGKLL